MKYETYPFKASEKLFENVDGQIHEQQKPAYTIKLKFGSGKLSTRLHCQFLNTGDVKDHQGTSTPKVRLPVNDANIK